MPIPYFIISQSDIYNRKFRLGNDNASYIRNSLRMNPGDQIEIGDGQGNLYKGILNKVTKSFATGDITSGKFYDKEEMRVAIAISLTQAKKFEFILQKSTELGIDEIYPLETEFSIVRAKRAQNKIKRWRDIILNACQQSRRKYIPSIYDCISLSKLNEYRNSYDLAFIADTNYNSTPLKKLFIQARNIKSLLFAIGPEGGFSEHDKENTRDFKYAYLGDNVLRMETAAVFTLSAIKFHFDNL